MHSRTIGLIIFLTILAGLLVYLVRKKPWEAFHSARKTQWSKAFFYSMLLYIPVSIVTLIAFNRKGDPVFNVFLGLIFSIGISLFIMALYFLVSDLLYGMNRLGKYALTGASPTTPDKSRRKFVRQVGIGVAAVPFLSFLYGITFGKYDFRVRKVKLKFPDLPEAFNGLRIAQISDVHSGSFDNIEEVKKGISMIQAQSPDLILFTGDFVNQKAEETDPYIPFWKNLSAPMGKYAVLGNHDYGFLGHSQTKKTGKKSGSGAAALCRCGFYLVKQRACKTRKRTGIYPAYGVENWGKPPFPQFGDLTKATEGVADDEFKLLMSHDPTHWDMHVLDFPKLIHLTMSGHTHGMQMGIDIPWLKLSIVKFVYPRWIDLYREGQRYLYVNRGFGWLGMPARVGIFPEITVFELQKG